MSGTPFVSVIIPVRDDPVRLRTCLSALEQQSYPPERFEVIVVDNGSDQSPEMVVADHRHARLLLEHGEGSYAARNRGLAGARGEVVAFTDADCIPEPCWLREGVEALSQRPGIGLVAGHVDVFPRDPRRPRPIEAYEQCHAFPQERYATERHFGATANVFTSREVIARVGPFQSDLSSGGDREWGMRVHRAGYEVIYSPTARVRHPARATSRELRNKLARVFEGERELRSDHGDQVDGWLRAASWRVVLPPVRTVWRVWRQQRLYGLRPRLAYSAGVVIARYTGLWMALRTRRAAR